MFPNRPLQLLDKTAQKYHLTEELKAYLMPYNPKAPQLGIPPAKVGVIVIHPATRRFYSTLVSKPKDYYLKMTKEVQGFEKMALPIKRMLEKDPAFDFFIVAEATRNYVEHALIKIGITRVATGRGELQSGEHALFRVECPLYRFARFVIAPKNTTSEKLVKKVNESINSWLTVIRAPYGRLKIRLRDGLGKNKNPQRTVFGEDAVVTLERFVFESPREYSKIVTQANLDEVQKFLLRTTGAVF